MKQCLRCLKPLILNNAWSRDYYDGRIITYRQYHCQDGHYNEEKEVHELEGDTNEYID